MGGNEHRTLFPSQARTATENGDDVENYWARGAVITINCTAITSTPSVVFTVQGKDPSSGTYYTILASAAIVAVGTTTLRIYPGLVAAVNLVVSDVLPFIFRVIATHANGNSISYTVGASLQV